CHTDSSVEVLSDFSGLPTGIYGDSKRPKRRKVANGSANIESRSIRLPLLVSQPRVKNSLDRIRQKVADKTQSRPRSHVQVTSNASATMREAMLVFESDLMIVAT